jgi:hypothetical protein
MKHTYRVAFERENPMTPPTLAEQLELARSWAKKNNVPNAEETPDYKVKKRKVVISWTWDDDATADQTPT